MMNPAINVLQQAQNGQVIPTFTMEQLARCSRNTFRGFEMLQLDFFAHIAEHLRTAHRYDFYTLIMATEGNGRHFIDFQEYEVAPFTQFFIAPGQVHLWQKMEGVKGYILFFTDEFVSLHFQKNVVKDFPFFDAVHPVTQLQILPERASTVSLIYDRLFSELYQPAAFQTHALHALLNLLLVDLSRQCPPPPEMAEAEEAAPQGGQALLQQFEHQIGQHFSRTRSVSDYADMLCISSGHLNALCRKHTGKSAGELIRDRVMLEAKRMLVHSTLGIAEIALKLDFEDNAYFSRFFKKYEGVTPEAFRQQYRHA